MSACTRELAKALSGTTESNVRWFQAASELGPAAMETRPAHEHPTAVPGEFENEDRVR